MNPKKHKFFLNSFFVIYCLTLFFMGKTSLASNNLLQSQVVQLIRNAGFENCPDTFSYDSSYLKSQYEAIISSEDPILIFNDDFSKLFIIPKYSQNLFCLGFYPTDNISNLSLRLGYSDDGIWSSTKIFKSNPQYYSPVYLDTSNFKIYSYYPFSNLGSGQYKNETDSNNVLSSYSNHSDLSSEEFSSLKYIKNYLDKHLLYNARPLYFNGKDVFYKWNGVWSGKTGQTEYPSYGGEFVFSSEYLYYYYDSELQEPLKEMVIDLNGYYPQSLSRLGENVYPQNDGDTHKYITAELNYDYSYYYVRLYDLIQLLDKNLIYRMQATSAISGDVNICTSEFFSTSTWKSDDYIIRNLNDYIEPTDNIVQVPSDDGNDSNFDSIIDNQNKNHQELLSNILGFNSGDVLKEINGVKDIKFDIAKTILDYETLFFNGSPSGDLVLEWNGINYDGVSLIPSGELNITKLINENPQLSKLHHIIQVFSISSFGILLISGYWNLILATIGAGSHFFVENSTYSDALESNASIDEFSDAIDSYNNSKHYSKIVDKARAEMLRKAGRK